jgi:pyridoxal phosphate enzyme (YggS family)
MIKNRLKEIKANLSENITLIAVSKTKPIDAILEAYDAGQRDFGENKVQELAEKFEKLPKDINWHMIGHLQSNKIKYIAPFIHLIHGVDSLKLLVEIDKNGRKINRKIPCLLQFHIAQEETKFGFDWNEILVFLESETFKQLTFVDIKGVMGMASFTDNNMQIQKEFSELKTIFDNLKRDYFQDNEDFKIISMGMSNDYKIAIEEGSNMVRIGSSIFGSR